MDFQTKFLPRELETMKLLDHPNIIKLYDVICIKDKVYTLPYTTILRTPPELVHTKFYK